jgi:hypothetical protein
MDREQIDSANLAERIRMGRPGLLITCSVCITILFHGGCGEPAQTEISKDVEQVRVPSPNGQLDAILTREDGGGAAGGWEWYVYIVAKGSHSIPEGAQPVLNAGTLTGGALEWRQNHLLEFRYNIAHFNQFRNLWGLHEIQYVGATGEHDYFVEIRLAPASTDFSLLAPDGAFRDKKGQL